MIRNNITKKAQSLDIHALISLTILVLICIMLLMYMNQKVDKKAVLKNYLVRENAFLVDAIGSSPERLEYFYKTNIDNVILDFSKQHVSVYDYSKKTALPFDRYPYFSDKGVSVSEDKFNFSENSSVFLHFLKNSNSLSISKINVVTQNTGADSSGSSCFDADTKWVIDKNMIVFDSPLVDNSLTDAVKKSAFENAYDLLTMMSDQVTPTRKSKLSGTQDDVVSVSSGKKLVVLIRPANVNEINIYTITKNEKVEKFTCIMSKNFNSQEFSKVTSIYNMPEEYKEYSALSSEYSFVVEMPYNSSNDLPKLRMVFKQSIEDFFK